jgi:hypothetical protein
MHYEDRRRDDYGFHRLRANVSEYEALARKYLGKSLDKLEVMEIGYGARPFRACAMRASGAQAFGIDLERPMFFAGFGSFKAIAKENGLERALKSLARDLLFGHGEKAAFAKEFGAAFDDLIKQITFVVGDASDPKAWQSLPMTPDLVYSEDVFEHIPRESLDSVIDCIKRHVKYPNLILIRPNIWTGITGGHFIDWYHTNVDSGRRKSVEPWAHLIAGSGQSSVYLNKLTLSEYTELFSKHFDILDVVNSDYGLGSRFLTEDVMKSIPPGITKSDLLTNNVLFVMRHHGRAGEGQP